MAVERGAPQKHMITVFSNKKKKGTMNSETKTDDKMTLNCLECLNLLNAL